MPVLYLIGAAAPPVLRLANPVRLAQNAGWDTCVILTPAAARWLDQDIPALEGLTGHPVRSTYKIPGDPDVLPDPDALLVAPATLNTLSKWALGIADNLALGLITEGIGKRLQIVALPYINAAQAEHPVLSAHRRLLEAAGIKVLLGEGGHVPHPPGHGNVDAFPWKTALECLVLRS
jgi:hypothetical protein